MAVARRIVALHGFLGSANDFTLVWNKLSEKEKFEVFAPNFFQPGTLSAALSYSDWTSQLLTEVKSWAGTEKVQLVGYSLGGRLALHAYFRAPQMFYAPLLLSTNPGVLLEPPEARRNWEAQWAEIFASKPWDQALQLWNQQNTFAGTTPRLLPSESQFSKDLVVQSLRQWSLLNHDFSIERCRDLPADTQWWFGEYDQRFLSVQKALVNLSIPGAFVTVSGAGHRLPLDAAAKVASYLQENRK